VITKPSWDWVLPCTGYDAGLFAENVGLAQWLAEAVGIPPEKIQVSPAAVAASQGPPRVRRPHMRPAPRCKLLLCVSHGDGDAAGGDGQAGLESVRLVLDAVDILRRDHESRVRLTIASLRKRPEGSAAPNGVTFRGVPMVAESMALFDSHDLLVMVPGPGANGLAEAFCRGIPCVAVRGSELCRGITSGVTGAVVEDATAAELAAAVASVLANDDIYRSCFERAPAMTAYFSWERVAKR
jgi:hypothetical protein